MPSICIAPPAPPSTPIRPTKWISKGSTDGDGNWSRYSQVLLPCEGEELLETPEALGNLTDYLNGGGRVLATHFSYACLFHNDSFGSIGSWSTGGPAPADPLVTDVVTSSPKGIEFATWLAKIGALSRPSPPQMFISAAHADLTALAVGAGKPATPDGHG